jgi:glycosyltransferase involved in cell wall biosynthesis
MNGGTRSYEMARRLVSWGHEVNMITSDRRIGAQPGWKVEKIDGIHVHWLGVPYDNAMGFFTRIRAFLTFALGAMIRATILRSDVIFATSTPLTIAIPGIVASRIQRIPMVFEVRDLWPDVPIAIGVLKSRFIISFAKVLEFFAYRNSRFIIVLAPGMADNIVAKGIPFSKIEVIPNGCDEDLFAGVVPIRDLWCDGKHLVIHAGTLGAVNGCEWIVRVASEGSKLDNDLRVLFIGEGRKKADTIKLSRDLGVLGKHVRFLDSMPKRELVQWLVLCDAAFVTIEGPDFYVRDSVTNKFFDAIAAGKPIFSNHHGFSPDIAVKHNCGVVLNKDPKKAAAELVLKLRDHDWLEKAGYEARELTNTVFSRNVQALRLEAILKTVVDEKRNDHQNEVL